MLTIKPDGQNQFIWAIFLTACFVVLTPLLMYGDDIWDGIIIRYAFESHRPEIFQTWFFEAGSPLGSAVYTAAYWLFGHWGINHKLLLNGVMFAAILACAWQLYHLGRGVFGFSHHAALAGALIYIFNPSWHILVSSVFFTLVIWNFFALGGLRYLLLGQSNLARGVGAALMLLSLHYAANPAWVLPILCFAFIGVGKLKRHWLGFVWVLIALVYFYLFRSAFPANALYGGYNQISGEHILNWSLYGQFIDFVVEYYWPVLLLVIAPLMRLKQQSDRTRILLHLLFFITLMAVTVLPFVVVDKVVNAPYDWSNRVTVNLTIVIALMSGFFINCFEMTWLRRIGYGLIGMTCLMLTVHIYQGYNAKIRALMYQYYYIDALKQQADKPLAPGLVFTKNLSFFAPDSYELNYYFYQAFGRAAWFVNLADDVQMAELMTQNQAYRDKYVTSDFAHQCSYRINQQDNIADVSLSQLWQFFLGPQAFMRSNDSVDFKLQLVKRGCSESKPMVEVSALNPLSNNKSLVQADVAQCDRFDFTKGQWNIAEPLVFAESCAVRILKDAKLVFATGSYMVVSGAIYFPESGYAQLTSATDNSSWGGILLSAQQAHVQRVKVSNAVGFQYQAQQYPAAINFDNNTNASIYYSEFSNNSVGVSFSGTKARVQESAFVANRAGLIFDNAEGTIMYNLFEHQTQDSIKVYRSPNVMLIRNIILASQAVGISVQAQSKVAVQYNWYHGNQTVIELSNDSFVAVEGDVSSENQQGIVFGADLALLAKQFSGQVKVLNNRQALVGPFSDETELRPFKKHSFLPMTRDNLSVWVLSNFKDCQVCIKTVQKAESLISH